MAWLGTPNTAWAKWPSAWYNLTTVIICSCWNVADDHIPFSEIKTTHFHDYPYAGIHWIWTPWRKNASLYYALFLSSLIHRSWGITLQNKFDIAYVCYQIMELTDILIGLRATEFRVRHFEQKRMVSENVVYPMGRPGRMQAHWQNKFQLCMCNWFLHGMESNEQYRKQTFDTSSATLTTERILTYRVLSSKTRNTDYCCYV